MELVKGKTYYKIAYTDPRLTMPGVMPKEFIGINADLRVEDEDIDIFSFKTRCHS